MRQHAQVGGGAAHVDDDGVVAARQVAGAADGVRRPARDGEDGIAARVFHGHERAVILRQVHFGVRHALVGQTGCEALGELARHVVQRRVQDSGVLALDQAHRADLAGDGHVHVLAQHLARDGRGAQLVVVAHGGEHAGHGHGLHATFHALEERAARGLVELCQALAIVLETALDDERVHAHRSDIVGPVHHRRDAHGSRRADAQDGDGRKALALHDGVRALGGAQHGLRDLRAVHAAVGQHGVHRAHDARVDIVRRGVLHRRHHVQVLVDQNGVRVGAAHVDAQFVHGLTPPSARCALRRGYSRYRCRSSAAPRGRDPPACATGGSTPGPRPAHACRTSARRWERA